MKAKKFQKSQSGFTLVELMVTIVIIGILVAIALPNFSSAQNNAKVAAVKINMETMQVMLETYASEWHGASPDNVSQLKEEATAEGRDYWRDFPNPYTNAVGSDKAYADVSAVSLSEAGVASPNPEQAGLVLFAPSYNEDGDATRYAIYGLDHNGNAITDRGQLFALSNS